MSCVRERCEFCELLRASFDGSGVPGERLGVGVKKFVCVCVSAAVQKSFSSFQVFSFSFSV